MVAVAFFLLTVICVYGAWWLSRARWPWRAPGSAIVLWQALGLAWGLGLIGGSLALALAPYGRGVAHGLAVLVSDVAAGRTGGRLGVVHIAMLAVGVGLGGVLVGALVVSFWDVVAARRRHRALLALVGHGSPQAPGAVVLDHPAAAAYCVPGIAPGNSAYVVVSEGTLRLLDRAELAAVLAHEWAHARQHHDLVLLPFRSLRRLLPTFRFVGDVFAAVELLVEMCADDQARRQHAEGPLAEALLRFSAVGCARTPAGGLAVAKTDVIARVRRLTEQPAGLPRWLRVMVWVSAAMVAMMPAVLAWLPCLVS
jgi:hypothetical protein